MDADELVERAQGNVSEAVLTRFGSGGLLRGGYVGDDPLIDRLEHGEQPHYALTYRGNGTIEFRNDDGDVVDRKAADTSYRIVALVTDRRVLVVAGRHDGDYALTIPLDEVTDCEYNGGYFSRSITVHRSDGTSAEIPAEDRPKEMKECVDYVGSGSDSPNEAADGDSGRDDSDLSRSATSRDVDSRVDATVSEDATTSNESELPRSDAVARIQSLVAKAEELNQQGTTEFLDGDSEAALATCREGIEKLETAEKLARRHDVTAVVEDIEDSIARFRTKVREIEGESDRSVTEGISATRLQSLLQSVDGYDFEELVADVWEARGWQTRVTSGSRDRGVDVVATRRTPFKEKHVVQAKRYSEGNKVGSEEIQRYASLRQQESNADAVVVVTTSEFTSQAESVGADLNVKLVDGATLAELILDEALLEVVTPYLSPA